MCMIELFKQDGSKASLYDVCEWWIQTYPPDIFIKEPKPIIEIRLCMQNILTKHKRQQK